MTDKTRIALGMSGGLDSSMSVLKLLEQGYDVVGITMTRWSESLHLPPGTGGCFGPDEPEQTKAAAELAARMGIEHHVIDIAGPFKENVIEFFRSSYLCGRTPNPCVRCNQKIKFGLLPHLVRAAGIEFDRFATGHYARIVCNEETGRYELHRAVDRKKDQSYFLAGLSQEQLAQTMFPLGECTKDEVRESARRQGFHEVADKPESQDFVRGDSYALLFSDDELRPGPIITTRGEQIGMHEGIVRYTIGQRKGLGISGLKDPLYVVQIRAEDCTVVVGEKKELYSNSFTTKHLTWVSWEKAPDAEVEVLCRIRQQHKEQPAIIHAVASDKLDVQFIEPQMSITPGQLAVFYEGERVLGSGIIDVKD